MFVDAAFLSNSGSCHGSRTRTARYGRTSTDDGTHGSQGVRFVIHTPLLRYSMELFWISSGKIVDSEAITLTRASDRMFVQRELYTRAVLFRRSPLPAIPWHDLPEPANAVENCTPFVITILFLLLLANIFIHRLLSTNEIVPFLFKAIT